MSSRLSARRLVASVMIGLGIGCLTWYGIQVAWQSAFQRDQRAALNRAIDAERKPSTPAPQTLTPEDRTPPGGLVGQLDIPRVHLSVVVMEGDDDATLNRAVGHLPDTPLPWDNGNSAFAGHRDTFLRPLKDVRTGDEIRLTSVHGTFVYRVRETRVVDPGDIAVLAPTSQPELTLVTCYPFYYVGNAPRRFIVSAERVESLPVVVATASDRTPSRH